MFRQCGTRVLAMMAVAWVVCASCGCIQLHHERWRLPPYALRFIDEKTGEEIPRVLVIPVHTRCSGALVPGKGTHGLVGDPDRYDLVKPRVYETGDHLAPIDVDMRAVMVALLPIPIAVISGEHFGGFLFVAPGYALTLGDPFERVGSPGTRTTVETVVSLAPADEPLAAMNFAAKMFQKNQLSPEDLGAWEGRGLLGHDPDAAGSANVRFTSRERALVRSFLQQGIERLKKGEQGKRGR